MSINERPIFNPESLIEVVEVDVSSNPDEIIDLTGESDEENDIVHGNNSENQPTTSVGVVIDQKVLVKNTETIGSRDEPSSGGSSRALEAQQFEYKNSKDAYLALKDLDTTASILFALDIDVGGPQLPVLDFDIDAYLKISSENELKSSSTLPSVIKNNVSFAAMESIDTNRLTISTCLSEFSASQNNESIYDVISSCDSNDRNQISDGISDYDAYMGKSTTSCAPSKVASAIARKPVPKRKPAKNARAQPAKKPKIANGASTSRAATNTAIGPTRRSSSRVAATTPQKKQATQRNIAPKKAKKVDWREYLNSLDTSFPKVVLTRLPSLEGKKILFYNPTTNSFTAAGSSTAPSSNSPTTLDKKRGKVTSSSRAKKNRRVAPPPNAND